MIILLQSVTTKFRRLFGILRITKSSNVVLLQNVSLLLKSASGTTKCDRLYYKMRQILQSVTVIIKCDITMS